MNSSSNNDNSNPSLNSNPNTNAINVLPPMPVDIPPMPVVVAVMPLPPMPTTHAPVPVAVLPMPRAKSAAKGAARAVPIPTIPVPPLIHRSQLNTMYRLIVIAKYMLRLETIVRDTNTIRKIRELINVFLIGRITCAQLMNGLARVTHLQPCSEQSLLDFTRTTEIIKASHAFHLIPSYIQRMRLLGPTP